MKNSLFCSFLLLVSATCFAQTPRISSNLTLYSEQRAKQTIDSIYNRLLQGDDFAQLAGIHSQDPGSFAVGGRLGWQKPTIYVPGFRDAIQALAINQYSKPFRTSFGYHIVQLLDKQDGMVMVRHILLRPVE